MNEKKFTATEVFEAIKVMANGGEVEVPADVIVEFCDKKIEQTAAKAAKAKERAAEKKAEADELTEVIKTVLTDVPQTREEILSRIEGSDITVNKVSARMTKLIEAGFAVKETVKLGDKRKRTAYKLA